MNIVPTTAIKQMLFCGDTKTALVPPQLLLWLRNHHFSKAHADQQYTIT